jgi:large subunit ribosomal protein L9
MATQYLLLEDVEGLGHSGEVVKNIKPGYVRNFLLPKKLVVIADKRTLRLQEKLKEQRQQKRLLDKQESDAVAARVEGLTLTKVVKVDHDGHMYGSVTVADIIHLLLDHVQVELDKKCIQLKHAIKTTGIHSISLKLKEGVTASFNLKVISEEGQKAEQAELEKGSTPAQ